jgi:thioredoxin reductase
MTPGHPGPEFIKRLSGSFPHCQSIVQAVWPNVNVENSTHDGAHRFTGASFAKFSGLTPRIRWLDSGTGVVETHDIRHVFVMTGAVPNTGWLDGCAALAGRGFIKTGPDLSPEDLTTGGWPLPRSPYLLETNRPGVFAVGDVRGGNIKRVASASAKDRLPSLMRASAWRE